MSSARRPGLKRREFLLGSIASSAAFGQTPKTKPNVLFIAIDDLNDWIGALGGHPQAVTPNLDRLAKRGVLFRQAYCQAPACNPSRASVLSGVRPSTSGVYMNSHTWRDGLPDAVTLPAYFKENGYLVAGGGKIFHGGQNDDGAWHEYYEFERGTRPENQPLNGLPNTGFFDWGPLDIEDEDMPDGKLATWTEGVLSRGHEKPFFLACGFSKPHLPWYAPQAYFDKFPAERRELPAVIEGDLDDVPDSAVWSTGDHEKILAAKQWNLAVASYLAVVNFVDAQVGRVLDALDRSPYGDNAIIVLWGDHGWQLGEKRHWRKFTLWERSARTVMMATAPGVTSPNGVCDRTVELLDLYPTLVDLCALPEKQGLEGASLKPLLADPDAPWDRPAITSNGMDHISVRTERWRYGRFADGEELYDHQNDPLEWHNLAGKPEQAVVQKSVAARLPETVTRREVKQWRRPVRESFQ